MDVKTGFFTKVVKQPLNDLTTGVQFGEDVITYEITKLRNVENLGSTNSFAVKVKHRILIPGIGFTPGEFNPTSFSNYPVMIKVNSAITSLNANANATVTNIFPRTLNSAVETTSNASGGTSESENKEHSSGSSTTNVNTFGVALNGGMFGDIPMGSITADYSHSWEHGTSHSHSSGSSHGRNSQASTGDEMSIKDWSSYGYLNNILGSEEQNIGEVPEWIWSQSYPWDIVEYHNTVTPQGGVTTINLPKYVQDRLLSTSDNPILLPPSHLAMFGLDFTMVAQWQIDFPSDITTVEAMEFTHKATLFSATHSYSGTGKDAMLNVTLDSGGDAQQASVTSESIVLGQYALAPIPPVPGNGAGIGFKEHLFDITPTAVTDTFKILSAANNLLVTGTGFKDVMTTDFSNAAKNATLSVTFKTADVTDSLSLIILHWLGSGSGKVNLSCVINKNWTEVVTVECEEGRGGQNNLSTIDLRNLDLHTANFHDYLVAGTNTIDITVTPADPTASNEYCLAAMAIA